MTGQPTGDYLPAHCVVQGAINSRTGKAFSVDPATRAVSTVDASYAVGFELRMPKDWTGRFFFQGGGGLDGVLNQAVGSYDGGHGAAAKPCWLRSASRITSTASSPATRAST
jgi:feruloyl esterase